MAEVGKITYLRRPESAPEIAPKRPIVLRSAAMFRKGAPISRNGSAYVIRRRFSEREEYPRGTISSDEEHQIAEER